MSNEDFTELDLQPWEYIMNTCECCDEEIPDYENFCENCKALKEEESL